MNKAQKALSTHQAECVRPRVAPPSAGRRGARGAGTERHRAPARRALLPTHALARSRRPEVSNGNYAPDVRGRARGEKIPGRGSHTSCAVPAAGKGDAHFLVPGI